MTGRKIQATATCTQQKDAGTAPHFHMLCFCCLLLKPRKMKDLASGERAGMPDVLANGKIVVQPASVSFIHKGLESRSGSFEGQIALDLTARHS